MKDTNRQLDRLLKTAAGAPRTEPGEPAFKLEAQVMAGWRSLRAIDDSVALVSWFRRAVVCAGLVMGLSLAWNLGDLLSAVNSSVGDEASLADSAMRMALNNE